MKSPQAQNLRFYAEGREPMTKEQFDEAVLSLLGVLHSVSYSLLPNPHDQADAVQECIKKALMKRESLREDRYFKTWLIRILVNECHNIHRIKKRLVPTEAIEVIAPSAADPAQFEAINRLEEKLRLPLVLHYVSGYGTREIAGILQVTESTVKYRLVRGRKLLQQYINEEEA